MNDKITKEQLLDFVAPCSILCYACAEFKSGVIGHHAKQLNNYFLGFYELKRDENVKKFTQTLEFLANHLSVCEGCRSNPKPDSCIKDCFILACTQEHNVDFCGECHEFPCEKVKLSGIFSEKNNDKWLAHNRYIKEHGAMKFFEDYKSKSQYMHHMRND